MKIKAVSAVEILDSRGQPTIETTTILNDGSIGRASIPSGASVGKYEAVELRDKDINRYNGLGVSKAVDNVNSKINKAIIGLDAQDQEKIDKTLIELDGSFNKANLGANAILSVSLSIARAEAQSEKKPLYKYLAKFNPNHRGIFTMPIPQMNVINGGRHANWTTDIQEYMLFPISAKSISQAVRMNAKVYWQLKKLLKAKNYSINVGDEGGFAPMVLTNEEPFQLLIMSIKNAGYQSKENICLGIDAAASEFYQDGKYNLNKEKKILTNEELIKFYSNLTAKYPIVSMEDVFDQDDWSGFEKFTKLMGKKIQIVGDDLYATNVKRLQRGIKEKTTNSVLIKLNQVGTLTETIEAILLARQNKMTAIISHRSGETEDTFIADLVVAMGTGQIKAGAPVGGERTAKYNRLMQIEKELGEAAVYADFPF